jgi:hypothetical protein
VFYLLSVRRVISILLLVSLGLAAGCGYQWVRYQGALGDARRIAIEGFTNDSFDPGVDSMVTDALYREFLRRGALRVVDNPRLADLILRGKVQSIDTTGRSFSSVDFSLEYQVRMRLEVTVTRNDETLTEEEAEVALDPRAMVESELYFASADVETTRTNREEALRRLSSLMAGRIHDALYERVNP